MRLLTTLDSYPEIMQATLTGWRCTASHTQQREAILRVATEEMEAACNEVGLQQQLQELEGLILQRGVMGAGRYVGR